MIGSIKDRQTTAGGGSRPTGFTLLETITVIAIFSLTVVASLNLYLLFFKNQLQVERQTTVQSEARFILSTMLQYLDVASIDYEYYGGTVPTNPTVLALRTTDLESVRFRYDATDQEVEMCIHGPAHQPCDDTNAGMWEALNDSDATPVTSFQLWVSPANSPFIRDAYGAAFTNEQPKVTVVLRMADSEGGNEMTLQTTLTSRIYER